MRGSHLIGSVLLAALLLVGCDCPRDIYDCYSLHKEYIQNVKGRDLKKEPYVHDKEPGFSFRDRVCRFEVDGQWVGYEDMERIVDRSLNNGITPEEEE